MDALKTEFSTEAQAIAAIAAGPDVIEVDGLPLLVTPDGKCEVVQELLKKPVRKVGFDVRLRHITSFIDFTKSHAVEGTEIMLGATGDIAARAVIDAATFREYGAIYVPAQTQSFKDWLQMNGDKMDQAEFALFIERHIDDIHPAEGMPSATDILTFCSTVEDAKRVEFKKSVSLQDGRVELIYAEKSDEAREQKLALFREFSLALRPFLDRDQAYAITASLRFRIKDGQIVFWYELKGIEALMEKLRADIKTDLEATGLPVYLADI